MAAVRRLALALVLLAGTAMAAPLHLRELPPLQAQAKQAIAALERHRFETAKTHLASARDAARGLGERGELALVELDAIECQIANGQRDEPRAHALCSGAFARMTERFGDDIALQSAAAVPLVNQLMLRSAGAEGNELLARIEAAMRKRWGEDAETLADIDHLWGGYAYYAGEYAQAREHYLRAYARLRAAGLGRSLEGAANAAQAALMRVRLGEPEAATEELSRIRSELPEEEVLHAIAFQHLARNLSQAHLHSGRLHDAVRVAEQGWLALREVLGDDDAATQDALDAIATNLGDIGRHADALALQRRLQPAIERTYGEVSEPVLILLNNMAFNLTGLGEAAQAVPLRRRVVELSTRMSGAEHPDTLYYTQQLAVNLAAAGAPQEAVALLETVEQRQRNAAAPVRAATRSHLTMARVAAGGGAPARASLLAHARDLVRTAGPTSPLTVQTAARGGSLLLKQDARAEARALLDIALAGIDRQLDNAQWVPGDRRAYFARHLDVYRDSAILAATEDCERALAIAERARGHGLLEAVARQRALETSGVRPEAREKLRALVAAREQAESDAAQAPLGSSERAALDAKVAAIGAVLASEEEAIARSYPRYARMRAALGFDLAASRRALRADEAFVTYVLGSQEAIGIVVWRQRAPRCVMLGNVAALATPLANVRRALSARAGSSALLRDALDRLSSLLLAPLWRDVASARHLTFAPDGALAALPFEMLPAPGERAPLIARREVSYAQSLAVHTAIRTASRGQAARRWTRDVLAFGGPQYAEEGGVSLQDAMRGRGAIARALGRRWEPLPGAEREAKAVAAMFARSRAITGASASEATLQQLGARDELGRYRYLLFATHAYLSLDAPSLSAVVLSLPGREGADGYVTAGEWPGYRLGSQLVVLSGCETGLGAEGAGEGVLGLPYALFVAGNRGTLLSLWPVLDEATAAFIVAFFTRLRAGDSEAVALARTKRSFMRDRRYADPLVWASFVLYGG